MLRGYGCLTPGSNSWYDPPLSLDLVLLQETHSIFQLEAIKGICVYRESEQAKEDYEMSVLRRAADFGPVLAKFLEETLEEV